MQAEKQDHWTEIQPTPAQHGEEAMDGIQEGVRDLVNEADEGVGGIQLNPREDTPDQDDDLVGKDEVD
jgi:hypothetical protein